MTYVTRYADGAIRADNNETSSTLRADATDDAYARMIARNTNAWRGGGASNTRSDSNEGTTADLAEKQRIADRDHQKTMLRLHADLRRREQLAAQALRHDTAGSDYEQLKAEMEAFVAEANRLIDEQMRSYYDNAWRNPSTPGNNDPVWKGMLPGGPSAGGMQPNALHRPGDQGGK